jgi:hypothetical protein
MPTETDTKDKAFIVHYCDLPVVIALQHFYVELLQNCASFCHAVYLTIEERL